MKKPDFILISRHAINTFRLYPIKRYPEKMYSKNREVDIFDIVYSLIINEGEEKDDYNA